MQAASLTVIQITATIDITLDDENDPYYQRTILTPHISSNVKFSGMSYHHLGFPTPGYGKSNIRHIGDTYTCTGTLDPNTDASLVIVPFKLIVENLGDSFMAVHIRLPAGKDQCKIAILQERYQPKPEKLVDDFINYEGTWYATAVINCLQTLRIEELKGDTH